MAGTHRGSRAQTESSLQENIPAVLDKALQKLFCLLTGEHTCPYSSDLSVSNLPAACCLLDLKLYLLFIEAVCTSISQYNFFFLHNPSLILYLFVFLLLHFLKSLLHIKFCTTSHIIRPLLWARGTFKQFYCRL